MDTPAGPLLIMALIEIADDSPRACKCSTRRLSSPQVRGSAPPPRVGHCAAVLGNLMIIFGGFVPSVAGGTPSEMPMAECDSGGSVLSARRRSSSRHARGDAEGHHKQPPQPHQQHRQHQQHQHQHQHQRGSYSNALYALHLERRSWSLPTVHLAHASAHHGASPPHRYALHLERRSWSLPTVHLAPGAAPPSARLGASAVAVHDVEVLFGGSHEGVPTAARSHPVIHSDLDDL